MKTPSLMAKLIVSTLALQAVVLFAEAQTEPAASAAKYADAMNLRGPMWVYDNWGAYDPTTIIGLPLTEELVMREIGEIERLKEQGVRFDAFMMNAFWFEKDTGYREWDKRYWPNGPDRWLEACRANGLKPGLWFTSNVIWRTGLVPAWQDSYAGDDHRAYGPDMSGALSMFEGGYLADFIAALQHWYDRGVRIFEFDMTDLDAATPATRKVMSKAEIHRRNKEALIAALSGFRKKNPEAILVGFNGFAFTKSIHPIDMDWLAVFETLFAGDTRVSTVPMENYWRSVELFNDERTRYSEQNGVPLYRSDHSGTVLSHTFFANFRRGTAWKSMILQSVARGAWKQTVYGALEEIKNGEDARWFARVQQLYNPLLANGRTKSFGGAPQEAEPYGFVSFADDGAIYTVVNPAQAVHAVPLERLQGQPDAGRVLFRDAGFVPVLKKNMLTLGPGQMAVVGFGRFAAKEYDLGIQSDMPIPKTIEERTETFRQISPTTLEVTFIPPVQGDLRIVFQQRTPDGKPRKFFQYFPTIWDSPEQQNVPIGDTGMKIVAWQPGYTLPVVRHEPTSPSGISWGVGEIRQADLIPGRPLTIRCSTVDDRPVVMEAHVYTVEY